MLSPIVYNLCSTRKEKVTNVCPLNYAKHSKPLLSRVYAGGRDICAILLDVPRCFSAEVALGPFALRHPLLSCVLASGNKTSGTVHPLFGQNRLLTLQRFSISASPMQ